MPPRKNKIFSIPKITDTVVQTAVKRFEFSADSEKENRDAFKADLDFYVSDQWDADIKNNRMTGQRPCLTINRLPQFIRQITNSIKQNMPNVRVIPVNDSDEDVAEILEGMMRHIQQASNANVAYGNAINTQVICGIGYYRIITEYADDKGFNKEIRIKQIKNPLSVYVDPTAIESDLSDAQYMFITEDIPIEEFKKRWPDKQPITNDMLQGMGDSQAKWLTKDESAMRIAEYFAIEDGEETTIYQLEDGSVVTEVPEGVKPAKERKVTEKKVVWRMISAIEVLEEKPWDGKYIPIVPCFGEVMVVDGKKTIKGMVRDATDPQRMYNYWASAQTEMIALAPKAPFVIALGQVEGLEQFWQDANIKNFAYLPYKPISVDGTVLGAPQRQVAEPPVQAMVQAIQQASQDLKATTGIYDASLGNQSNETSGKAINARKLQGDIANYHYVDNFTNSLIYTGKILLDLIRKTYDVAHVARVLGEDETYKFKKINQPSGEKDNNGIEKIYDITVGDYDVVIDTGPSYKTKRQESADQMATIAQGNPQIMQLAGDIIVRNMDLPGANELAERLKKALPPELQDVDPSQEIPLPVKQKLDQYGQLVEQLTAQVHQLADERDSKILELNSKKQLAEMDHANKIIIEAMRHEQQGNFALLQAELKQIAVGMQALNAPIQQNQNVEQNIPQVDNGNNNATISNDSAGESTSGAQ